MSDLLPSAPGGEFLFYQTEDGRTRLQVRVQDETVWLSQKLLSELFQKDVRTINEHIQNIFEERELSPDSVVRKFRITAADGKTAAEMICRALPRRSYENTKGERATVRLFSPLKAGPVSSTVQACQRWKNIAGRRSSSRRSRFSARTKDSPPVFQVFAG